MNYRINILVTIIAATFLLNSGSVLAADAALDLRSESDAIVEKFKFLFDFGISHFSKLAVVTDKKWIHKIVDIEDKIFKNIDMKGFAFEEKDKAIGFL